MVPFAALITVTAEGSVHYSGRTRLIMGAVGVAIGSAFLLFGVLSSRARSTKPKRAEPRPEHRFPRLTQAVSLMLGVVLALLILTLCILSIYLVVAAITGGPPHDSGA